MANRELESISVNIYADTKGLVESVNVADDEIKGLKDRVQKRTIKLGVQWKDGAIAKMEEELNALEGTERDIKVNVTWAPGEKRKGQFRKDIQKQLNAGDPISLTGIQLGLDQKVVATQRQKLKDALSNVDVDVNAYGVWKGWKEGPPDLEIPVVGGGPGPSGQGGGSVITLDGFKKALEEFGANLKPTSAAEPASTIVEKPASSTPPKSSATTGGAAGTVRETTETTTTTKTTKESKAAPAAPVEETPQKTTVAKPNAAPQPKAGPERKVTQLPEGAASGAPVLMGRHAGGGGDILTAQLQQVLDETFISAKDKAEKLNQFFKDFGIGFEFKPRGEAVRGKGRIEPAVGQARIADLEKRLTADDLSEQQRYKLEQELARVKAGVKGVVPSGPQTAALDFSSLHIPKTKDPFQLGLLEALGVDWRASDKKDMLKQLQDKLSGFAAEFNKQQEALAEQAATNATEVPGTEPSDFAVKLADALKQGGIDVSAPAGEAPYRGPSLRPGKKGMSVQRANSAFRLLGGTGIAELSEEHIGGLEARLGREDLPDDERKQIERQVKQLRENQSLRVAGAMFREDDRSSEAAARADAIEMARGELFEQMASGEHPFLPRAQELSTLTDLFIGGTKDIGGVPIRDQIASAIADLEGTIHQLSKGEQPAAKAFRSNVERARAGLGPKLLKDTPRNAAQNDARRQSYLPIERTIQTINTARSFLGRDIRLNPDAPASATLLRGGQRDYFAQQELTEILANQARAESAATNRLVESYVAEHGMPQAAVSGGAGGSYAQDYLRVLARRVQLRPQIDEAKKALREGGPELEERMVPNQLRVRREGLQTSIKYAESDAERARFKEELAKVDAEIKKSPTRREHLQSIAESLPQYPVRPGPESGLSEDTQVITASQEWVSGLVDFLRENGETIDKAKERTSAAPRRRARTPKIDADRMLLRRGEIFEQLTGGATGATERSLRAELASIDAQLPKSQANQRVQELTHLLEQMEDASMIPESAPTQARHAKLRNLTRADLLEAEAAALEESAQNPYGVGGHENVAEAIAAKRERAKNIRAQYEPTTPDRPAYLQQLLAGAEPSDPAEVERRRARIRAEMADENLGEGPGTPPTRGGRDPRLTVPTGVARIENVVEELGKISSSQQAAGILRRSSTDTSVAQASAAQLYKQGVRAVNGQLVAGGGGAVQKVFVTNWPAALVRGGTAAMPGTETPAAVKAAQPVVPLAPRPPSPRAKQTAHRFFGGDVPPGFDTGIFDEFGDGGDEDGAAPFDAEAVAARAQKNREFIKQRQDLLVSRSPTVALGQAFQTLFGGRPEVQIAIRQATAMQTEIDTRLRRVARRNEEDLPKTLLERRSAELAGDTKGVARAQKKIERLQIDTDFDIKKIKDLEEALPAVKEEFSHINPVLRSFAYLTGGAIGGTLIFGATLKAASAAIGLAGAALKPVVEELFGYQLVTAKVTGALSDQTRQQGGAVKTTVAQATAYANLSEAAAGVIAPLIEQRVQGEAANKAMAEQLDLLRASQNIARAQRGGYDQSLFETTGGFLGTPLFGIPSAQETLAKTLREIPNLAERTPFTDNPITAATRSSTSFRMMQGMTGLGNVRGAGSQSGPAEVELAENTRKFLSAQFEKGGGGQFKVVEATRDQLDKVEQVAKYFADAGLGDVANALKDQSLFVTNVNSQQDALRATRAYQLGAVSPDPALIIKQLTERVLPAAFQAIRARGEFSRDVQLPGQRALQLAAHPLQPFGFTFNRQNLNPLSETGLQTLAGINQLQGIGETAQEGIRSLASADALFAMVPKDLQAEFGGVLKQITAIGAQINAIQRDVTQRQLAQTTAEYNNQLRISSRSKKDILDTQAGINGAEGKSLGLLEGQNIALQRQSQLLQFQATELGQALQQRQINFSRAVAGFVAPGTSPQERAARIEEAKVEADYAQQQLDIQRELLELSKQLFDNSVASQNIGLARSLTDIDAQINLLEGARAVAEFSAAAGEALQYLNEQQAGLIDQASTYLQEGTEAAQTVISAGQQAAEQTNKSMSYILSRTATAWGIFGQQAAAILRALEGSAPGPISAPTGTHIGGDQEYGFAGGFLGSVSGPTSMTVGEAGTETVAVLRNPRQEWFRQADQMQSGIQINVAVTGNTVSTQQDAEILAATIARKVEESLGRRISTFGFGTVR